MILKCPFRLSISAEDGSQWYSYLIKWGFTVGDIIDEGLAFMVHDKPSYKCIDIVG